MFITRFACLAGLFLTALPLGAATEAINSQFPVLTGHFVGLLSVAVFILAYAFVALEEKIHLPKSKPVLIASAIIWFAIAIYYSNNGQSDQIHHLIGKNLLEYTELFLFLLVAMTYINSLEERRLFEKMQSWLSRQGFTYRKLFWITGWIAFILSPIADNLTTALALCAVIVAVGKGKPRFVGLGCVNLVVAANAGGAFSPFGDITTLMVWQSGKINFIEFFQLFIPSIVNFIIPTTIMSFFIPDEVPSTQGKHIEMKRGAYRIFTLFVFTIATSVIGHAYLNIPPAIGMMAGLGYLNIFGYYLVQSLPRSLERKRQKHKDNPDKLKELSQINPFNVFSRIAKAEWDTLLFFYGVVMCIGGLGVIGYLELMSELIYGKIDVTIANSLIGVLSALIDNIPVMFAVLNMDPQMSHNQWLLVTLTAGVGGSLLSIGSAAGVALMGQAKGMYTFMLHLRWLPVILLGYIASIATHLFINGM